MIKGSRMRKLLIAAICATVATPVLADSHEGVLKARQGYMQLVWQNFGPLTKMAKGEMDYDADQAALHADNLDALASMNISAQFPEGTDKESLPGETRALPVIWTDMGGFSEKFQNFADAVQNLRAEASEGLEALQAAVGQTGNSCGGCHDDYRAKEF